MSEELTAPPVEEVKVENDNDSNSDIIKQLEATVRSLQEQMKGMNEYKKEEEPIIESTYMQHYKKEAEAEQKAKKQQEFKDKELEYIKKSLALDKELIDMGQKDLADKLEQDEEYRSLSVDEQHITKQRVILQEKLKITGDDFSNSTFRDYAKMISDYTKPLNSEIIKAIQTITPIVEQRYVDNVKQSRYNFKDSFTSNKGSPLDIIKVHHAELIANKAINQRVYTQLFGSQEEIDVFNQTKVQ